MAVVTQYFYIFYINQTAYVYKKENYFKFIQILIFWSIIAVSNFKILSLFCIE